MRKQLLEFLSSSDNRRWIKADGVNVYLRKASRVLDQTTPEARRLVTSLDIGSVEVSVKRQGRGIFKAFLALCRSVNPCETLFVENVQSERFANFFKREGMHVADERCLYPCFWEVNPNSKP